MNQALQANVQKTALVLEEDAVPSASNTIPSDARAREDISVPPSQEEQTKGNPPMSLSIIAALLNQRGISSMTGGAI